jgi:hypothetical protein
MFEINVFKFRNLSEYRLRIIFIVETCTGHLDIHKKVNTSCKPLTHSFYDKDHKFVTINTQLQICMKFISLVK